jgi:hypothetical protein
MIGTQQYLFGHLSPQLSRLVKVTGSVQSVTFEGPAYEPKPDKERLTGQLLRVFELMSDGHWRTLREIADHTSDPEASISAQLRHLRKPKFGAHQVERQPRGDRARGLFEYRLLVKPDCRVGRTSNETKTDRDRSRNLTGEKLASPIGPQPRSPWLIPLRPKLDILRLWERALEIRIEERELRELLGSYGCTSRKELTPEQAPDFISELSRLIGMVSLNVLEVRPK